MPNEVNVKLEPDVVRDLVDRMTEALDAPTNGAPTEKKFRTSIYFDRAIHDRLREIAFAERKTVTDLINEGVEHVLQNRGFAAR